MATTGAMRGTQTKKCKKSYTWNIFSRNVGLVNFCHFYKIIDKISPPQLFGAKYSRMNQEKFVEDTL